MSEFARWRIKRHIRIILGNIAFPFAALLYRRAAMRWRDNPCAKTREAAFKAQDRMWHCNHARALVVVMGVPRRG